MTCNFCLAGRHIRCNGGVGAKHLCTCNICGERRAKLAPPPPKRPKPQPEGFQPVWNPDTRKWSFAKEPRIRATEDA